MKKIITIMLVASLLTLGGCGKKEKIQEAVIEESTTMEEFSVPEIEESSEEPKEEERSVDFNFMKNDKEVNAEDIVNHAHKLGVLEKTWNTASELDPDDIVNAYMEKYQEENSSILEISEEEIDEVITAFLDIPVDILHKAESYKESSQAYAFEFPVEKEESSEETELEWPVKVSEVISLGEDVYEIVLVDATNEDAPVSFGTLTVENNENVPKYLSFIKPEETVAEQTTSGTTTGGGTTDGTTSGGTTTDGGTGGTTTGSGTGGGITTSGTGGSMWDGIELPGDPNVPTYKGEDISDYPWAY